MTLDTLLKSSARSLYLSAKILPRKIRRAFYCGYLFCRAADSIADASLIEPAARLELIKKFPRAIDGSDDTFLNDLKNAVDQDTEAQAEKTLLENIHIYIKEYNNLAPARQKLVADVVRAVCGAMEWDLSFFPAEKSGLLKAVPNDSLTINYCDSMGGAPGIFWAKLLLDGRQDDAFINDAKNIGRALQITNILRDIAHDAAISRCYLPLTDLTAHDLMPQDLPDKKNYKKLRPVVYKWISWGLGNISRAPDFMAKIPRRQFGARAAAAWPILWSLDTFLLLAQSKNLLDKTQRVKIPRKTIYLTMLASPFFCCSNFVFRKIVENKIKKFPTLQS